MDYFRTPRKLTRRIYFPLPENTVAHLRTRAKAAGRSLEMQICYELMVTHNQVLPDPGDTAAAKARYWYRGIYWSAKGGERC